MEHVTLDTTVQELLDEHPELVHVFARHDIDPDVDCLGVTENTLEDAAMVCGFDPQEMVDELNAALQDAKHVERAS